MNEAEPPAEVEPSAEVELSAGVVEYLDRGTGPTLVFLHGLLTDETLWSDVVDELAADHRCVVPVLPLGSHRKPIRPEADLSPQGIAALVAEFLVALDLDHVTLIGNDTGGALLQLLMAADGASTDWISHVVLTSCDAFDNFPPGLTGRTLFLTGKLSPSLFGLFMQQMRLKSVRRLPIAFGWLTKRGDAVVKRSMRPIWRQKEIRRDTVRLLRAASANRNVLAEAAEHLPKFDRPALVVWAADDRVMPPEHGRRLAELLPDARLVEIADSFTLIPLDQPVRLAAEIRGFLSRLPTVQPPRSP
ncbi:alpha/beta hydrolase [Catenulispora yoronensis]|uniref:Alpha/beta hydrolase n=1 Tax=Catenulispora yoronensis TaxID=450799 RepID=A0ABP5GNY4_9ACTN